MKVLCGLVLVAAIALVQGRSASIKSESSAAAPGDNPALVHLRLALGNGSLGTCAGALIHNRWVVTTASCVQDARFVWVRYGAETVPNPELVTETSAVRLHPNWDGLLNDIALISLNRHVEYTDTIKAVSLEKSSDSALSIAEQNVNLCSWGLSDELTCSDIHTTSNCAESINTESGNLVCAVGSATCNANSGSPLIVDDQLVGLLARGSEGCSEENWDAADAVFTRVGRYIQWIESETGVEFEVEEVGVAEP